jgi:hypothetical protein
LTQGGNAVSPKWGAFVSTDARHWQGDRLAALQDWEAALCAYELEAARFFAAGYLDPDADLPAVNEAVGAAAVDLLLGLRCAEEQALRRYVRACRQAHV